MTRMPKPPALHQDFVRRYPKIGEAWESLAEQTMDEVLHKMGLRKAIQMFIH